MAKLVIKFNNDVVDHVELRQGDMKIGRKPGCEVVLDNLAVSGEHANVFTIGEDSFIQDLGSTNGTFINNKKISKHHLRNGDTVTIGKHALVYLNDAVPRETEDFAKTVIINPSAGGGTVISEEIAATEVAPRMAYNETIDTSVKRPVTSERQGALFVLSGANSGRRIDLSRTITNLGKTGKRSGTITRLSDGYLLAPGEDGDPPKLNGRAVTAPGVKLKNGDIIEITGTRLQFYFK
jgi:pSer/pThr/pTyr-binding forkhead associated (FHA) protein